MEYLDLNCTSKEKISDLVQKFAITAFGLNFKFRPNQKETIVDIICQWKNGTKNVILNAPTGSGKSYIALIIGGVLSIRHYVLCQQTRPEKELCINPKFCT